MAKIIICCGPSSEERSNWSKKWVLEDSEHRVRFSRNDAKNMLDSYYCKSSREDIVDVIYNSFMDEAMIAGRDIVIDSVDFSEETATKIEQYVYDFNEWIRLSPLDIHYSIEYKK